jgi:hypothetical protein
MGTPKKYSTTAKENVNSCKEVLDNDENLQSQADKDENEFNSAVCDVEAHELYLIMTFVFAMTCFCMDQISYTAYHLLCLVN